MNVRELLEREALDVSEAEAHVLLHTLGLLRSRTAYRNYFIAGDESADMPILQSLEAKGLMVRHKAEWAILPESETLHVFHATTAGIEKVKELVATAKKLAKETA